MSDSRSQSTRNVPRERRLVLPFKEIGLDDLALVGGKNASLGEMYRTLAPRGVRVADGFAITVFAFRHLLEQTEAEKRIREILAGLDASDMKNLAATGHAVRALLRGLEFPPDLKTAILESYEQLGREYGPDPDCAVRSSATAEDLPEASFAGQQDTYLNIREGENILQACKCCYASLFTNRAISYRQDMHFDQFAVGLSIGVQKMVRSDQACSGVVFTIDTESGFRDAVFVTSSYGLGENIVQGAVNPDEFYVFKPTLRQGFRPIIRKSLGDKKTRTIYSFDQARPTKIVSVPASEQRAFSLTDDEVLELARMALAIEDHYSARKGGPTPMDIEWAKDGPSSALYIVQARPETVHSRKDRTKLEEYVLEGKGEVIVQGKSVGKKIGAGAARIILDAHRIDEFRKGEVLVTDMTDPDWEPIMKIAAAIVTNRGGRTCHAAIVSRELGIPCIVGTGEATDRVAAGEGVTVDCSQGEVGSVLRGVLPFKVRTIDLGTIPRTRTQVMMNLGNPEQAFEQSFIPNDGVGLAREEFIISSYIKAHPQALLSYDQLKDEEARRAIAAMTSGWTDKGLYFIDKLAEGMAMIAAAFYPKKVIVRLSDFKSNEYANLVGGRAFEPREENPMLGWRGASRYYDPKYKAAFGLECKALLKVREEMGLTNVEVMIPFPRTVEECREVIRTMAEFGLEQGRNGLRVIGMCEVPSNVILADEFLDVLDGFSIGTNDLTQLTLGVDRDSELVARVYDERNDAVKRLVKQVIEACLRRGKYIGICGQAPSDYPEFARFVVECGIQTMSLNPDTVIQTIMDIAPLEKKLEAAGRKPGRR
jgi:pyruvate,water dikinase